MKDSKLLSTLSLLIGLLLITSCQTTKKSINSGLSISNLWIISSFEEDNSMPNTKSSIITINQKENKFNGNGACNAISGNAMISGNFIKFEKIKATRMACPELEQETKFIKTLEQTTNFKISGCELFLYNGTKKIATLESCR